MEFLGQVALSCSRFDQVSRSPTSVRGIMWMRVSVLKRESTSSLIDRGPG